MSELSITSFIAIFEEMFGFWLFWGLVAVAGIVILAFLYTLISQGGLRAKGILRGELFGLFGGVAAVWFVLHVTGSSIIDMGGPIDVILLALIWLSGAIGVTMITYVALALILTQPSPEEAKATASPALQAPRDLKARSGRATG